MAEDPFQQDVRLEYYRAGIQATREIGLIALRTLITLNSGAFVVLLTFIGNTAAQSKFSVPLESLRISMALFVSGISLTFVAIAHSYVASQAISPYPPQRAKKLEGWYLPVVVVTSTLAFLCFVGGVMVVVLNVGPASP